MGLKNKLNKMKSFLFDEVDDEKEIKKISNNKLDKRQTRKISDDYYKEEEKEEKIEQLFLDEQVKKEENNIEVQSRTEKPKFNFQEFDDEDFMVTKKKPEPLVKKEPKIEPKRVLYQGSKFKNENKKFTPSPIISPIYGLLDDEGNMVKESKTKEDKKNITFDSVRKKAYGTLDDEFEDTMDDLKTKTIEEAEKEMEEKLSRQKKKKQEEKKEVEPIESFDDEDDDDDMILPNINFKEINIEKEASKKKKETVKKVVKKTDDDDDDDTKEQDLFNLIDTMYQKEGDDE